PLPDPPASPPAPENESVIAAASATPSTAVASPHIQERPRASFGESVGKFVPDAPVLIVGGIILGLIGLFYFKPDLRRRLANVQVYRAPLPASGPRFANGGSNGYRNGHSKGNGSNGDAKTKFTG